MLPDAPSAGSRESRQAANALPNEKDPDRGGEPVSALLARVCNRRVPVSSLSRLWILGSRQAKVAAGYFVYWLRSRFADAEKKERLLSEAHVAAALELLATMGYMRGAVMKVGQTLANLPDLVPDEFADVLGALHFEAPPMHYAMIREVFLDEFDREPEEVFASFERRAFAAASLGQVHRARLHTGEEVAVKIQYPDIARTVQADVRNLRYLLQPARLTGDWPDLLAKLDDLERVLLMETDYEQEARFAREARAMFGPESDVVVPRVFDECSTRRVLTTEYLPGCHLREFLATEPSQERRDRFTGLIAMATLRLNYRARWCFADPSPGNFRFMPDGRLGLLDFGCIRVMSGEDWRLQNEIVRAVRANDMATVDRLILQIVPERDGGESDADWLATMRRSVDWLMEPFLADGLFDFGNEEFFRRGIDSLMEMYRKRYTEGPPLYIWTNRFIYGSRAVAYRLKGRCDFKTIARRESVGAGMDDSS